MNNYKGTRVPKQNRSIKTKRKIMEAAKKLFSDKGYYNTNSKEISDMAEVSIGSFYSYFKDKRELFLEIVIDIGKEIKRFMEHELNDKALHKNKSNAREVIYKQVKKVFDAHNISPKFHREVSIMKYFDPDVRKIMEEQEEKEIKIILNLLTKFKNITRVKDLESAAVLIFYSIENVTHATKFHEIKIDEERIINEFTDMLIRYLLD